MAEYITGSPNGAKRIGILPSAFNPPTVAHLALATSCRRYARLDQVVLALPRALPHKSFSGASLQQRLAMVQALADQDPKQAAALTEGGLFIEIAREFQQLSQTAVEVFLICGKDAAERIAHWDYGEGPSFEEQLREFTLLVGDRGGRYFPPPIQTGRIIPVRLPIDLNEVSSQTLRERRAQNEDWQGLTTPAVARLIEHWDLYR